MSVKAFTLYPKEKREFIILLDKLKNYGDCNCDVDTFIKIFNEWLQVTFPGCKIDIATSVNFRSDWFASFVNYIANYNMPEVK
jgi:hypothetical protein